MVWVFLKKSKTWITKWSSNPLLGLSPGQLKSGSEGCLSLMQPCHRSLDMASSFPSATERKESPLHLYGETLFAMVNFRCQSCWIWKHLGDSFLSMVLRKSLHRFDCEGKTQPKRGQNHLMDLAPQLNEKEERANWATTLVFLCFLTEDQPSWLPVTGCLDLPQLLLPVNWVAAEIYPSSNLPCKLPVLGIVSQQWEKQLTHYLYLKKESNSVVWDNMKESKRHYYAKWKNSGTERLGPNLTSIWNLKRSWGGGGGLEKWLGT